MSIFNSNPLKKIVFSTTCIISGFLAINTASADIYKTTLPDGTVVYSDKPSENAPETSKKMEDIEVPTLNFEKRQPQQHYRSNQSPAQERKARYNKISISSPKNEATFRNIGGSLTVQVSLDPALQQGHKLVLMDNGAQVGGPSSSTSITANNIYRGSHSLSVNVIDAKGKTMASSNSVTIYVHQSGSK